MLTSDERRRALFEAGQTRSRREGRVSTAVAEVKRHHDNWHIATSRSRKGKVGPLDSSCKAAQSAIKYDMHLVQRFPSDKPCASIRGNAQLQSISYMPLNVSSKYETRAHA
jgi:hypothetical protein